MTRNPDDNKHRQACKEKALRMYELIVRSRQAKTTEEHKALKAEADQIIKEVVTWK